MTNPTVGFIGVGLMGHGMAKNAVEKGFPLLVTAHRKREAVDDLVKRGAQEVLDVATMAQEADIIVLCVTGTPEVEANLAIIMENMKPGMVVIDTSTAEPGSTRELAARMAAAGGRLVDAPLSRTPSHAWDGELTTFVSGSAEDIADIRPLLDTWAAVVIPVGGAAGTAHSVKLVNNLVAIGYASLWSECYATMGKLDVNPATFREVIRASGMHCGNFETFSDYAVDGDPNSHKFSLANCQKDIGYYENMAKDLGATQVVSDDVLELLDEANAAGMGEKFLPELVDAVRKP